MRQDNPILQLARAIDTAALRAWRIVGLFAKIAWNACCIWWRSPWFQATGAALFFAAAAFGQGAPLWGYVLGVLWLYLAVARAVRGPSYTILGKRDPSARGFFRIRLATLALVVALLANHSNSTLDVWNQIGYFLFAVVLLVGLDRDIKA